MKYLKINHMDRAIVGINEERNRLIYNIADILDIIMDDTDCTEEEAHEVFEQHIKPMDGSKLLPPIFCWDSPFELEEYDDEDEVESINDRDDIRNAYSATVSYYVEDSEIAKELVDDMYRTHKRLHESFLNKVKNSVDEIARESKGVDVMLDLINLLKSLE